MKKPSILRNLGIAVLVAGALAATGCGGPATSSPTDASGGPTTPVKVALGFTKNVTYAGNWIADDQGFYAEQGVAPTFIAGGPNAPAPEVSLASGEADIAVEHNSVRLFSYLAKSQDVVVIGQRVQRGQSGLLSLAKRPVRTRDDLKGAKIIAPSAAQDAIKTLMKINGVSDYTFVPGGTDVAPLLNGQGDALLSFGSNQPLTLEQQFKMRADKDFYFTPYDEFGYNLMTDTVIVRKKYLESNREAVVKFMAATIKGWEAQMKDPAVGAELAVSKYGAELGLNLEQQTAVAKADIPYMTSDLTKDKGLFAIDPRIVQDKVYSSLEAGGITGLPDAASVVDTTVVADAHKLLGR